MNEPQNAANPTTDHPTKEQRPSPSPFGRSLLLVLIAIGASISGMCQDLLSASIFAVIAAGLFTYCFLLTFSPLVFAAPAAALITAFASTGSFYHGLQALLFLPLGASLCLSMLRMKSKTTAVLRGAAAIGLSLLVLFSVSFIMTHGTISPSAVKEAYNTFFDDLSEQMTESMIAAYQTVEQSAASASPDLSHPVIDAPTTEAITDAPAQSTTDSSAATAAYIRALVSMSVNSVKLALPALFAIAAQVLAYLALGVYQLIIRLCRTPYMLPRRYRITVSRAAAVIFIVAYLINLFGSSDHTTVLQIATANLTTMLMPGIFLMGLNSLVRRAKDPLRRRSFIITAVVIGFLIFVFPSYAIFFVLIDGIGEIFFGGRSIF